MKDSAFENFSEGVMEAVHDFARCQRADGSFYGTGGVCRKGTSTGAKEKAAPKGKSASGGASKPAAGGAPSAKDVKALDKAAKAADKKADAADKKFQKSKSKADQKAARAADKEAKAANKAADKADKAFQKQQKKEEADRARSQKQKQNAGRTKALREELNKRKAEMKGASPERVNELIAEASRAANRTEQLRQINTQEGRGGGAGN